MSFNGKWVSKITEFLAPVVTHIALNHKKLAMEMEAEGVWRFVTVLKVEALTGSKVKEIKIAVVVGFVVIFMICALGQAEIAN